MNINNPIESVDGVSVRCPSSYNYNLQDVSAPDSGRTEAGDMDKCRIGQCVKLELQWSNVDTDVCSQLLRAFNPEYVMVKYFDLMLGRFETKEFYVGDRKSKLYNGVTGIWSELSFNLIERNATNVPNF